MERTRLTLFALALIMPVLLLVGLATAVVPPTAHAAPANTITVTTLNDSGAGSLRQAIADVDTGGTIDFNVSGTIVLASELLIDKNLTITVSGNNATRVFNVITSTLSANVNVTLDSLTIISGTVQTGDCGTFTVMCGGGIMIQNSGVAVTVTNITLSGNSASKGGGIFNSSGTMAVNNSTLSSNSSTTSGGGGIYNNEGTLTVTHSTLFGNSATSGGGIYNNVGTSTVNNSTLSGNSATNTGGGIANNSGTLMVNHSTLSGNSANYGGGIHDVAPSGTCDGLRRTIIHNSTLSGNSAVTSGGGIYNFRGVTEFLATGH